MHEIREKRERLGLTQREFADALGLGKHGDRTIRRWENGETSPSTLELQALLAYPETPNIPPAHPERFTMIDLFAGIGGIRLAFQELGGVTVFSSEWDKHAAKTYRANFGELPAGDITRVPLPDIPEHDLLVAGFPCQPFSQAGLKRGFEDTRGTLFFEIARIIDARRPKAFLLENVKQLRGHDKGQTLAKILDSLDALNYEVYSDVLRAADFGVPQNRERIFIAGFDRERLPPKRTFKFPEPTGEIGRAHV